MNPISDVEPKAVAEPPAAEEKFILMPVAELNEALKLIRLTRQLTEAAVAVNVSLNLQYADSVCASRMRDAAAANLERAVRHIQCFNLDGFNEQFQTQMYFEPGQGDVRTLLVRRVEVPFDADDDVDFPAIGSCHTATEDVFPDVDNDLKRGICDLLRLGQFEFVEGVLRGFIASCKLSLNDTDSDLEQLRRMHATSVVAACCEHCRLCEQGWGRGTGPSVCLDSPSLLLAELVDPDCDPSRFNEVVSSLVGGTARAA